MNNLDRMRIRALYANSDRQHERMIEDKLKTFHRALLYSYQAGWIKKDYDENAHWCRALINPDKVKFDYDEKIVSVDSHENFKPGDSFEWPKGSKTHWLIYKQEISELAYFRGNIRRCQLLAVIDPDTKETINIWTAIRGPVETQINEIQKAGLTADVPNLTLHCYVPYNEVNLKLFKRYYKFSYKDLTWEVQAYDNISTPGIIEFTARESFECHGDELLIEQVDPNSNINEVTDNSINGDTFIKPLFTKTYSVTVPNDVDKWSITLPAEKNKEIKDVLEWKVLEDKSIQVKWTAMASGSFILHYGELEKTIVVESLF